jgi:hypothetical protein
MNAVYSQTKDDGLPSTFAYPHDGQSVGWWLCRSVGRVARSTFRFRCEREVVA